MGVGVEISRWRDRIALFDVWIGCMELGWHSWIMYMMLSFIGNLNEGIIIGKSLSFFLFIFILLAGGIRVQIIRLVIGTEENW